MIGIGVYVCLIDAIRFNNRNQKLGGKRMSDLLIDKVKKQREESFEKWFERWFEKSNFEKEIIESSAQGYQGYRIVISEMSKDDAYLKRRLREEKTVQMLKEKLPGFDVEYVKETWESQFFGMTRHNMKDFISITW